MIQQHLKLFVSVVVYDKVKKTCLFETAVSCGILPDLNKLVFLPLRVLEMLL